MGDPAAPALLGLTLVYLGLIFTHGRFWGKRAAAAKPQSAARLQLRWSAMLFVQYGLPALTGLALLGRGIGFPREFAPLAPQGGQMAAAILVILMPLAMVAGFLASRRRARHGREAVSLLPVEGPRNWREIGPPLLLSVSAAVWEELLFRLFVPLLLTLVTGQPLLAFALATLIFALGHGYQGAAGIAMAGAMGAALAAIYLIGAALWMPMLLHFTLLANAAVVRPMARWGVAPV